MHGDCARVECSLVPPDPVHQLVTREDLACVSGEEPEKAELLRRQRERGSSLEDLPPTNIELESVEPKAILGRGVGTRPTQDAPDACGKLPGRERLRHVVVGAELQTDDSVGLVAAGC